MRKLTLDVEQLEVESFHTHGDTRRPGTIQGHGDAFGEAAQAEEGAVAITVPITPFCPSILTCTCPQVTYCASCVNTCETCYGPTCMTACQATCASGGPVCCA
ncbi:MAG TPA: hypothetical protein VGO89_19920 [Streptomyces sp.]|nr:hypothetical protein [Streptomyces sp.]